ncbi:MAG: spore cortex biosynthesis protein YabQ [Eubacterium sp.]|nr:spore cortex biosynthesis protein YabQ [Eubacterium sp.]
MVYDIVTAIEKALILKTFKFISDFLFMCFAAFAYICFQLAFGKGEIRWYFFFFFALGYSLYVFSLHRIFPPFFAFLTRPWVKLLKFLSKKLKKGEKSLKKLLHFAK